MEPPEIAVEVLGGDAAEASQEALDLAVTAVDRLDVQGAADPLAGGTVDALVRDVERRCDGRIAAAWSFETSKASRATTGSSASLKLFALRAGRVWLRVAPALSAATRIGTCSRERPRLRALPPRRRGLRSSFRSPLRLSRTKVSSASTITASRSGVWRTASRKRWRQRNAALSAIPQRYGCLTDRLAFANRSRRRPASAPYGAAPTAPCL